MLTMDDFYLPWDSAGLAEKVRATLDISPRTWRRYLQTDHYPVAVRFAVEVFNGDLSVMHPTWKGWTLDFKTGYLFAPGYRRGIHPNQVMNMQITFDYNEVLEKQNQEMKAEIQRLRRELHKQQPPTEPATVLEFKKP